MRLRLRNKFILRVLAAAAIGTFRLLFLTLRRRFHTPAGTNPYDITVVDRFIYCVWHDQLVIPIFGGKHRLTAALVSNNRDGSVVATSLNSVGIVAIRGSSSQGGAQAMRQLLREAEGKHIVITPDGPRGPRRELQTGAVYLASRSGRSIVPTAFSCEWCLRFGQGWTDLLVPIPFSKVYLLTGDPIQIPPDIKREELIEQTARVQAAMDALNARADQLASRSKDKNKVETAGS